MPTYQSEELLKANAHHEEEQQEKVNYLSMRFQDILELPYNENKKAIDITCSLGDKDVIVSILIKKELNEKGELEPNSKDATLMNLLEYLSEYRAREIEVTVPRLNGDVVVATIKVSIKEKTVA